MAHTVFANKETTKFVNKKATWFTNFKKLIMQLEQGEVKKFPLLPKEDFENADSSEQIKMLKSMLIVILKTIKVSTDRNILCFMHEDRNPSMFFNQKKCDLHCFSCQEPGQTLDIFDLLKLTFALNSFVNQKQKAIELFVQDGTEIVQAMKVNVNKKNNNQNKMNRPKSADNAFSSTANSRVYINAWDDRECINYLISRGLTEEIVKRFNLMCWDYKANKYLVIPCAEKYCVRRKFKDGIGTYSKFWNKTDVPITMFNNDVFDKADDGAIILVFESAIDAITATEIAENLNLNFHAVAINGLENYNPLIQKANLILSKRLSLGIILDNDTAGIQASRKIYKELKDNSLYFYFHMYENVGYGPFLSGFKDLNDAFVSDPSKASEAVKDIYSLLNGSYADTFAKSLSQLTEEEKASMLNNKNSNPLLESFGIDKILPHIK